MFLYGQPQQLQYAVANSMLASLYANYMKAADVPGWNCKGGMFYPADTLNDWARSQVLSLLPMSSFCHLCGDLSYFFIHQSYKRPKKLDCVHK